MFGERKRIRKEREELERLKSSRDFSFNPEELRDKAKNVTLGELVQLILSYDHIKEINKFSDMPLADYYRKISDFYYKELEARERELLGLSEEEYKERFPNQYQDSP